MVIRYRLHKPKDQITLNMHTFCLICVLLESGSCDRVVSSAAFCFSIDLCSNSVGFWQGEKHKRSWQHFTVPEHRVHR
jgi:hypothetical protein